MTVLLISGKGVGPHIRDQKRSKVFLIYLFNGEYFATCQRSGIVPLVNHNFIKSFVGPSYVIKDLRGQNGKSLTFYMYNTTNIFKGLKERCVIKCSLHYVLFYFHFFFAKCPLQLAISRK